MLNLWQKGPRSAFRLSQNQVSLVSSRLVNLRKFVPKDFARKPRALEEIDRWKATEFRQFLLYTAHYALRGILSDELFEHFMTLSVAICILVSPELVQVYSSYAHQLLLYFAKKGTEIYGEEFPIYNINCLVYLMSEAVRFGGLDNCSA